MIDPISTLSIHSHAESKSSVLNEFAPLPKMLLTVLFLFLTVSFQRYDWTGTLIFAGIPFGLAWITGHDAGRLFRRTLIALPFILCAGIANCFFDRSAVAMPFGGTMPGGFVSLFVLIFKTLATAGCVLLLSASTPMNDLSGAMASLHIPCVLILQIQLMFRYLGLVMTEAASMKTAYFLRNPECRHIPVQDWGHLTGHLFLRTVERSEAVYRAMQCRLFHAGTPLPRSRAASGPERMMAVSTAVLLIFLRCFL